MIDFDKILSQDAFKVIEKEKIEHFKIFAKKIKNKPINDVFFDIINFFNSFPKGKELNEIERQALLECVLSSISEEEQDKLINILKMLNNFK